MGPMARSTREGTSRRASSQLSRSWRSQRSVDHTLKLTITFQPLSSLSLTLSLSLSLSVQDEEEEIRLEVDVLRKVRILLVACVIKLQCVRVCVCVSGCQCYYVHIIIIILNILAQSQTLNTHCSFHIIRTLRHTMERLFVRGTRVMRTSSG